MAHRNLLKVERINDLSDDSPLSTKKESVNPLNKEPSLKLAGSVSSQEAAAKETKSSSNRNEKKTGDVSPTRDEINPANASDNLEKGKSTSMEPPRSSFSAAKETKSSSDENEKNEKKKNEKTGDVSPTRDEINPANVSGDSGKGEANNSKEPSSISGTAEGLFSTSNPTVKHPRVVAPCKDAAKDARKESTRKRKRNEMDSANKMRKVHQNTEDRISTAGLLLYGKNVPSFIVRTIGTDLMSDVYVFLEYLNAEVLINYSALKFKELGFPTVIGLNYAEYGFKPTLHANEWIGACDRMLQWTEENNSDILQLYNIWMYVNSNSENLGYLYVHQEDRNLFTMGFVFGGAYFKTLKRLKSFELEAIRTLFVNYISYKRFGNQKDSLCFLDGE